MEKYLPVLKKCPLFQEIAETDLFRMLHCLGAKVHTFDKKYTVFAEGSPARNIGIVLSGAVQIMLLDASHILHTCQNHCGFHQKIEITSRRTTRDKLLTYLMLQEKKAGQSSFDIPFDRQELADFLEVDRSGLSAEIGKLRREGVLENTKNHFVLL